MYNLDIICTAQDRVQVETIINQLGIKIIKTEIITKSDNAVGFECGAGYSGADADRIESALRCLLDTLPSRRRKPSILRRLIVWCRS